MSLPKFQPSMNGNHKAPPEISGAFPMAPGLDELESPEGSEAPLNVAQQRNARLSFSLICRARSLRTILYNLYHHEWAGGPLTRWLWGAVLSLARCGQSGYSPRWLGIAVAACGGDHALRHRWPCCVVRFRPLRRVASADGNPAALSPSDKIAVYATGIFTVEGQYHRFTYLPGYFRTFATANMPCSAWCATVAFARSASGRCLKSACGMPFALATLSNRFAMASSL